ncbi:MAG TPA: hypothetical protein VLX91_02085 [Candidatus Acidoferrales bacterium]|nr:hypothetical protein [Candidatus Acidoferrales bacterium]
MSKHRFSSSTATSISVSALIQLFPLALGINILASKLINADLNTSILVAGYLFGFFLLILDSIIEYGAYDFSKLPFSLYVLSILYTFSLTAYAVCLGFLFNNNFPSSLTIAFMALALGPLIEAIFCFVYHGHFDEIKNFALYEKNDYKMYGIFEIIFVIIYFFSGIISFGRESPQNIWWVPWLISLLVLTEQVAWFFLKSDLIAQSTNP